MSFSYKTLSSNDITLTSYIANKQWEVNINSLSQNGIKVYIGENIPLTINTPFNPETDTISNNEYRRLLYDSIKHLYYSNYISSSLTGSFFNSSSYFNFEQTTLELSNIKNFPTDSGSKIAVISIDQEIYGSGLTPNSVYISGSDYFIKDDGEGNLYDGSIYIGNIFYSHGLLIITNQDYLCILGAPPTAVNNNITYLNTTISKSLNILENDICECGTLLYNSFTSSNVPGYPFPDFTYIINSGTLNITPNQSSVIPGNYKLKYTVNNSLGLTSNEGDINLTITSKPLEIFNIVSSSVCSGNSSSLPVTFSINYGVPYYSYSLDKGNTWSTSSNLFNVTVSGSVTASSDNIIYVKDYLGEIVTQSFSSWHPSPTSNIVLSVTPCSDSSANGEIYISGGTATTASINSIVKKLPATFKNIGTGSYTINLTNNLGCTTSSIFQVNAKPSIMADVTDPIIPCFKSSPSPLKIQFKNIDRNDELKVYLADRDENYIYNNEYLENFEDYIVKTADLYEQNWKFYLLDKDNCVRYSYNFTISSPEELTFDLTASYISTCSNAIIFNATGGTPPYTYFAYNSDSLLSYVSTSSLMNLNGFDSGTFITYVVDKNNCISAESKIDIWGREYIYSGSTCEII